MAKPKSRIFTTPSLVTKIFAGNITKQPAFIRKDFKIADHLNNTDLIMNNTFFLGTYPGITEDSLNYTKKIVDDFIEKY